MLQPDEVTELRTLLDRVLSGSVTRRDWSTLAALMLISNGEEACVAIAAEPLDTFVTRSQAIYAGHAFEYEDFARIYWRVCEHARA